MSFSWSYKVMLALALDVVVLAVLQCWIVCMLVCLNNAHASNAALVQQSLKYSLVYRVDLQRSLMIAFLFLVWVANPFIVDSALVWLLHRLPLIWPMQSNSVAGSLYSWHTRSMITSNGSSRSSDWRRLQYSTRRSNSSCGGSWNVIRHQSILVYLIWHSLPVSSQQLSSVEGMKGESFLIRLGVPSLAIMTVLNRNPCLILVAWARATAALNVGLPNTAACVCPDYVEQ